ncbi:MAG: ABC transporter permease [Saprospiraceae bacterium]
MIKNYFLVAFRNIKKHGVYSIINISGLAIGLTACFLIFLYVRFELSYDQFHTKLDRIYRLVTDIKTPSEVIKTGNTSWAFGPNIKPEFPEVEAFARVEKASLYVRNGENKFQEDQAFYADSTLFEIFDFKIVSGNPHTVLKDPLSIVLSETTARKYFNTTNPIGQTMILRDDTTVAKVTGVMKDMPLNSQIQADMFVSMSTRTQIFNKGIEEEWGGFGTSTYLLLKPGADPNQLTAKFPAFIEAKNGEQRKQSQMFFTFLLEPMKDVYLRSTRGSFQNGSIRNVYVFSIVAIFILLLACINFINLTTARSAERGREVGIRKVAGAAGSQLISQFMGESVILCLFAFILTLGCSYLFLPLFNKMAGKIISPGIFHQGFPILILLSTSIGVGLLAGIYPAVILSSFQPVTVLKGRFTSGHRGVTLRKSLVVMQFVISITLIIGTLVVYRQTNFMRSHDLGFNKDQMLILDTKNDPAKLAFLQELSNLNSIKSTSIGSAVPGGGNSGAYSQIENKQGDFQIANLDVYFVDYNYIPQYQMTMVAGRAFSKEFGTDTTQAMVINETAVHLFGYASPSDAIGRKFKQWGREGNIIGVVKDFHFRALQQKIKPLTMRMEPGRFNKITAKVQTSALPETIAAVENLWKKILPNRPFSYYFLDEFFDRQYRGEERFGKLFFNFAILAIFISCLGLLGLASYSTLQRTREIGIRKVVGASVFSIVNLLSKDFIKLVCVSILIAAPLAWFGINKWLQDFEYRVNIGWWVFVLAGMMAITIALLTVGFQAIRAAVAKPVKSLRIE